jgi:flagellar assembly protein FliH
VSGGDDSADTRFAHAAGRSGPPPGRSQSGPAPSRGSELGGIGRRFIPRQSIGAFTSWQPVAFGEAEVTLPTRPEIDAEVAAARQRGYDQGYGDGIAAQAALDDDRARQAQRQVGELLRGFDAEFAALEDAMAQALARAATRLAREMLRAELTLNPAHVATLAHDAVDALLASARHIVVKVNPQDLAPVEHGAGDAIRARGAKLVADASIARGGVRVMSDIGAVDATLAARWRDATAALCAPAWDEIDAVDHAAAADAAVASAAVDVPDAAAAQPDAAP